MPKLINLFRQSAKELRSPHCLALTALFIALNITMDLLNLRIQITPALRVGFGYVLNASVGLLFGPVAGISAGFCTDLLGYLVNQGGGFYFPGYTLTAMVGGLLYGLWLYQPDQLRGAFSPRTGRLRRLFRVVGAKASINLICNIGLNTFWLSLTQGQAFRLLFPARALKNLTILPIECLLLFFVTELVLSLHHSLAHSRTR